MFRGFGECKWIYGFCRICVGVFCCLIWWFCIIEVFVVFFWLCKKEYVDMFMMILFDVFGVLVLFIVGFIMGLICFVFILCLLEERMVLNVFVLIVLEDLRFVCVVLVKICFGLSFFICWRFELCFLCLFLMNELDWIGLEVGIIGLEIFGDIGFFCS